MSVYRSLSDQELIVLLRTGDHAAFTEIYDRYWNTLLAVAYNQVRDKSSAKEVVQELFISVWNRKDSLQVDNLKGYLATAVKFAIFKQIERERRHREIENKEYQPDHAAGLDEIIEAKFLQEFINGQVELLPEKCRLVFNYSRVKGMTIPEIAAEMDISQKTVEGHLTKSLKAIRYGLKDSGIVAIVVGASLHEWIK